MHELAIAYSIVDLVAKAAKGRNVARVTVEIGKLSGAVPGAIAFCFPEVAKGTEAEAAMLDICEIDATARCDLCGAQFATPSLLTACPSGSLHFQRLAGEELNVKSIELGEAA